MGAPGLSPAEKSEITRRLSAAKQDLERVKKSVAAGRLSTDRIGYWEAWVEYYREVQRRARKGMSAREVWDVKRPRLFEDTPTPTSRVEKAEITRLLKKARQELEDAKEGVASGKWPRDILDKYDKKVRYFEGAQRKARAGLPSEEVWALENPRKSKKNPSFGKEDLAKSLLGGAGAGAGFKLMGAILPNPKRKRNPSKFVGYYLDPRADYDEYFIAYRDDSSRTGLAAYSPFGGYDELHPDTLAGATRISKQRYLEEAGDTQHPPLPLWSRRRRNPSFRMGELVVIKELDTVGSVVGQDEGKGGLVGAVFGGPKYVQVKYIPAGGNVYRTVWVKGGALRRLKNPSKPLKPSDYTRFSVENSNPLVGGGALGSQPRIFTRPRTAGSSGGRSKRHGKTSSVGENSPPVKARVGPMHLETGPLGSYFLRGGGFRPVVQRWIRTSK